MDKRLLERLQKVDRQIKKLLEIEEKFLYLDAHKKVLFSELFRKSEGKNVAEKEANAYSSQDWKDFILGLAKAEAEFNLERRNYELRLKAFDSEYITYKIEERAVKRQAI